jgi:hypothetical protein
VVTVALNLLVCTLVPTSYLWHCATEAHQPCIGLDTPDQGADQRPNLVEINLTIVRRNPVKKLNGQTDRYFSSVAPGHQIIYINENLE